MLSDEEKKAIEVLNHFNPVDCGREDTQAIETILNLIEKQSKEIEELKEEECCMTTCLRKDKEKLFLEDKIKAKIEELQEDIKYSANPLSIDNSKFGIKVLQSLLEKE